MLNLNYKNSDVFILIEEDTTPYICGFIKNEDIFFSISMKVYKNSNGRKGRPMSKYSHMWNSPAHKNDIYAFIHNLLVNPSFREKYRTSECPWKGEILVDLADIDADDTLSDVDIESIAIETTSFDNSGLSKTLNINNKIGDKNISLKLDLLSLLISDEDIEYIKTIFKDRPSILYAMRLVTDGKSLEDAVVATIDSFKQSKKIVCNE